MLAAVRRAWAGWYPVAIAAAFVLYLQIETAVHIFGAVRSLSVATVATAAMVVVARRLLGDRDRAALVTGLVLLAFASGLRPDVVGLIALCFLLLLVIRGRASGPSQAWELVTRLASAWGVGGMSDRHRGRDPEGRIRANRERARQLGACLNGDTGSRRLFGVESRRVSHPPRRTCARRHIRAGARKQQQGLHLRARGTRVRRCVAQPLELPRDGTLVRLDVQHGPHRRP